MPTFCRVTFREHRHPFGASVPSFSFGTKIPQSGWLKAAEMYPLTILEARCLKSRCRQGWFLLEALRSCLCHASLSSAAGDCQGSPRWPWPHASSLCFCFTWPSPQGVSLCPESPLLLRTSVIGLVATHIWYDPI